MDWISAVMHFDKTPSISRNCSSSILANRNSTSGWFLTTRNGIVCALFWHASAIAGASSPIENERRAYRLCLAQAVTAVEDRFSPPADVVAAVKRYCTKEEAALSVMSMTGFAAHGREAKAAEAWAASYVVAVRSCLSGACALLEAMQRDDLGL
jgi:hypothetical protein